jgi:hypothetical protein
MCFYSNARAGGQAHRLLMQLMPPCLGGAGCVPAVAGNGIAASQVSSIPGFAFQVLRQGAPWRVDVYPHISLAKVDARDAAPWWEPRQN